MHQKSKNRFERKILCFDLEFYVPKKDRDENKYSLKFNPGNPEHKILGGVFTLYNPQRDNRDHLKYDEIWIWESNDEEKEVLKQIKEYFDEAWRINREEYNNELDVCGIGISRVDLPALYIKSLLHEIDAPQNLFNSFFKSQHLDLSNIAVPFFTEVQQLHPISANRIYRRFGFKREKESGVVVWDWYDEKNYDLISKRTKGEVKDILMIFDRLTDEILNKKVFSSRKKQKRRY